jgi:MFS family permease
LGADFEQKYQLLYSVAQAPGVFMPIVSGAAVDRFGGRICLLLLSSTCLVGQIIASCGVEYKSWPIIITGRFIFGLGFEALFASNQAFLASWFSNKEIGYAFGISSAISYTGFLLSFVISPACANAVSTAFSFWVGAIIKSLSVCSAIIAYLLDSLAERQLFENQSHSTCSVEHAPVDEEAERITSSSQDYVENHFRLPSFSLSFWLICCLCLTIYGVDETFVSNASGLMLERNLFVVPPSDCRLKHPDQCPSGYLSPATGNPSLDGNNMSCPESKPYISHAPPWPESLNVTTSESELLGWKKSTYVFDPLRQSDINCLDPFFSEACTKTYCKEKHQATESAGFLMTIPYLVTICTTFLFGHYFVDTYGWRVEMLNCAPVILGVAHLLLLLLRGSLIPALVLEGIGYSVGVSALCASLAVVVNQSVSGLAFGLYTSIQNLGLTVTPLIVAKVYSHSGKYLPSIELLIIGIAACGTLFGILLRYADKREGARLHARVSPRQLSA